MNQTISWPKLAICMHFFEELMANCHISSQLLIVHHDPNSAQKQKLKVIVGLVGGSVLVGGLGHLFHSIY